MMKKTLEQDNKIADFEKALFASVTITSFSIVKGCYRITNLSGDVEIVSDGQLLRQTETRKILMGLTGKIMPIMNRSEYLEFVQHMMDHSSAFQVN